MRDAVAETSARLRSILSEHARSFHSLWEVLMPWSLGRVDMLACGFSPAYEG